MCSIWTTAVSVFEVEYGLRRLPQGRRRKRLERLFREILEEELGGRILALDAEAALAAGAVAAERRTKGKALEIRDVMIAGIVNTRRGTLATRNVRHFEDACPIVDPWAGAA